MRAAGPPLIAVIFVACGGQQSRSLPANPTASAPPASNPPAPDPRSVPNPTGGPAPSPNPALSLPPSCPSAARPATVAEGTWTSYPVFSKGQVYALGVDSDGTPILAAREPNGRQYSYATARGQITLNGTWIQLRRFDGTDWVAMGDPLQGPGEIDALRAQIRSTPCGTPVVLWEEVDGGDLGPTILHMVWWDGSAWQPFGATAANGIVPGSALLDLRIEGDSYFVYGLSLVYSDEILQQWSTANAAWQIVGRNTLPKLVDPSAAVGSAILSDGKPVFSDSTLYYGSRVATGPNGSLLRAVTDPFTLTNGRIEQWDGSNWARLMSIGDRTLVGPSMVANGSGTAYLSWSAGQLSPASTHEVRIARIDASGLEEMRSFTEPQDIGMGFPTEMAVDAAGNLYAGIVQGSIFDGASTVIWRYGD
jgi:hypothetical protein